MAGPEQKAMELMAQAEKKSKSTGGFFSNLFSSSSKQEEAAELYVKAANTFKIAKKWAGAGEAFSRAAEIQIALKSNHEGATHFVDAANCYKKTDPNEAVNCLLKAIEIYTDMGRFTIAAKHNISIAEIYESELIDIDKAIAYYEQAADFYKGEESNSSANKCLLKVAQYAAQQEQYDKAIEIYEQLASTQANSKIVRYAAEDLYFRATICRMCLDTEDAVIALPSYEDSFPALVDTRKHKLLKVATTAMDNQLLRYSAKDYFFRAAICRMCQEIEDGATSVAKYEEMFPAFSDSRECKLVKNLLAACEEQNVDAYTDAVKEYDSISRLDQWYTTMLLRIKKSIEGDVDLR